MGCCGSKKKKATSKKEAAVTPAAVASKSKTPSRKSAEATPGEPEFTAPDYPYERLLEGKAHHTADDDLDSTTKIPQSGLYIDNGMWLNFVPAYRPLK